MKSCVLLATALMAGLCVADEPYAKQGGAVIAKGSFTGKIAFVDTQEKVPFACAEQAAALIAEGAKLNAVALRHGPGTPAELKKELGVQVIVTLVNDPAAPVMLLAPEDHWGQVNVAKLVDDLPSDKAKERFISGRARKEMVRAFSLISGGGSSQFPGNLMNAATVRDLDRMPDQLPVDMIEAYTTHLKAHGVTPKKLVSYKKACAEGWAPAPTNDLQRTIWKEACAVPDQPMKIEYKKNK